MTDWSRSRPLSWVRACSSRIAENTSTVNSGASGSGPSRAIPATCWGSWTTYTASFFCVPCSVRSNPDPSSRCTRSASGPLPGPTGVEGSCSRQCSQPARARWTIEVQAVDVQVEELPEPAYVGDRQPGQRAGRRVVGLQHADRRHVDPRDDATDRPAPEELRQGLDLGELGHLPSLGRRVTARAPSPDRRSRFGP